MNSKLNRITIVLLILAIITLAACSGGSDEQAAAPTDAPPQATEAPTEAPATVEEPAEVAEEPEATEEPEAETEAAQETEPPKEETAVSEITLGEEYRSDEAGFAFLTIPDYIVEGEFGMTGMYAPDADSDIGPSIMFMAYQGEEAATNEQMLEKWLQDFEESFEITGAREVTVDGVAGLTVDINGIDDSDRAVSGRLVVVAVPPMQRFVMLGAAPGERWADELAPLFDAVVASVSFFEPSLAQELPASEPPASAPEPAVSGEAGMHMYSNGNYVQAMILHDGTIWAATLGGVVSWDMATGETAKYTTLNGLSHNGAYDVTVCPMPEPRLVFGVGNGLNFYDPATDTWEHGEALVGDQMGGGEVSTVFCDAENGRLLVDSSGLGIIDINSGELQRITTDDGLPWNAVRDVAMAGQDIWVASGYKGVSLISGDTITVYNEENGNFPTDGVYKVLVGPDGSTWFGSDEGLIRFQDGQAKLYDEEEVEGLASFGPSSMVFGLDGTLWLDAINDVCQFDPATETCLATYNAHSDPEMALAEGWDRMTGMVVDEQGNIYYSTSSQGLSMFDGSSWHLISLLENEPLLSNYIGAVDEDSQGNVWVCPDDGLGLTRFNLESAAWEAFEAQNSSDIVWRGCRDMVLAPDGRMLFLQYDNIVSYDGTTFSGLIEEDQWPDSRREETITIDQQDRVWIGGRGGVSIWDGQSFTNIEAEEIWPEGVVVYDLLADGPVVWAGTDSGLFRFEGEQVEQVLGEDTPDLPGLTIRALAKEADGGLMLGTNKGLARFDGQQVTPMPEATEYIYSVSVGNDGSIWAGVTGWTGGVHHFDGQTWEYLTTIDGVPHTIVRIAFVDSLGGAWIGGDEMYRGGGLLRIVP